jgi:hypothetical protein
MDEIVYIDADTRVVTNQFGKFKQIRKKSRAGSRRTRGKALWVTVGSELKVIDPRRAAV